jgi:hypothetical protein
VNVVKDTIEGTAHYGSISSPIRGHDLVTYSSWEQVNVFIEYIRIYSELYVGGCLGAPRTDVGLGKCEAGCAYRDSFSTSTDFQSSCRFPSFLRFQYPFSASGTSMYTVSRNSTCSLANTYSPTLIAWMISLSCKSVSCIVTSRALREGVVYI